MKMTNQSLETIFQILITSGIIITAIGGFGAFYFGKQSDAEKQTKAIPVIDLCHKGINVFKVNDSTLRFDIPYCASKNANAYNVKLMSAIILKQNDHFEVLYPFSDEFPDGIVLTYEQGKSISYSLSPLDSAILEKIYICIKGQFTNDDKSLIIPVKDIFKLNPFDNKWVRTLGEEDKLIRAYINDL